MVYMIERIQTWCRFCRKKDIPLLRNGIYHLLDGTSTVRMSCHECNAERQRRFRSTEEGRKLSNAYIYKSTKKLSNKQNARMKVAWALKSGKLIKKGCEVCKSEKSEAHHPDYDQPLMVQWLCRTHHSLIHSRRKK